jgi:hypothetical protein
LPGFPAGPLSLPKGCEVVGILIIVGLIAGIWAVGRKLPGTSSDPNAQSPGPDRNLPALGATDKFSPAITGGTNRVGKQNRLRADVNSAFVRAKPSLSNVMAPEPGSTPGFTGNLTGANYDGGYKREDSPLLTAQRPLMIPRTAQRFKI